MNSIKPGDTEYSMQAENASDQNLASALEAVQIFATTFAHGQFFDMTARHIGGPYYIVSATANDGYNSYQRRFLVDKNANPPHVSEIQGVRAHNSTAGRKVDSGMEVPGMAFVVVHDASTNKTLEAAALAGDTDLLPPHDDFTDVHPGEWWYSPIMRAVRRGIISGYNDGSFRPGAPLTRAQLCKILDAALGWT